MFAVTIKKSKVMEINFKTHKDDDYQNKLFLRKYTFEEALKKSLELQKLLIVNVSNKYLDEVLWSNTTFCEKLSKRFVVWKIKTNDKEIEDFRSRFYYGELSYGVHMSVIDPRFGIEVFKFEHFDERNLIKNFLKFFVNDLNMSVKKGTSSSMDDDIDELTNSLFANISFD